MKPEMKKLIIANLPYLLFVYLFGKLGQTYRLAAGADLSEKLLHLADGFSLAFESAAPSFHLFDLAVGVAGAVALRLMVYCRSKNAKKYRRGVEYGSARWGGPKDIAPYIDPVFDNNILLTQTERLTMNNRPKDPKTARNKNVLVIGGSGSGKTRFFVKPNLVLDKRGENGVIYELEFYRENTEVNEMNEYDRLHRQAQRYKELYPEGTRILLLHMGDDPRPVEDDMRGTVMFVDDMSTVHCKFDNGRQLGIIPGEDSFRKLTDEELAEEQDEAEGFDMTM